MHRFDFIAVATNPFLRSETSSDSSRGTKNKGIAMSQGESTNTHYDSAILVVEDNEVVGEYICTSLKMAGFDEIRLFTNPRDAVSAIKDGNVKLVITDIYMPGLNGFAITRWLRRLTGSATRIPAIVVTADQTNETREKLNANGVSKILPKPLEAIDLVQAVNELLGEPATCEIQNATD